MQQIVVHVLLVIVQQVVAQLYFLDYKRDTIDNIAMQQFQAEVNISKTRGSFFLRACLFAGQMCVDTRHHCYMLHVTCYVKVSPTS